MLCPSWRLCDPYRCHSLYILHKEWDPIFYFLCLSFPAVDQLPTFTAWYLQTVLSELQITSFYPLFWLSPVGLTLSLWHLKYISSWKMSLFQIAFLFTKHSKGPVDTVLTVLLRQKPCIQTYIYWCHYSTTSALLHCYFF